MKTKLKNIFFSLLVAFALLFSANFPLAFSAVNTIKQLSLAEYKPTDFVTPYEFSTSTGWSDHVSAQSVKSTFSKSKVSVNLSELTAFKPETNYKGDSTLVTDGKDSDFGAMMIYADETPIKADVEKKDEDNQNVYVKEADGKTNKIFTTKEGDESLYVKVPGQEGKFYKKELENINVTYYYESNSKLSLKANNYYVVIAYICTLDADASLMVTGTNFEKEVKVQNTGGKWQQVYLFLETSSDGTDSVNLRFYYGNSESIVNEDHTLDTETGVAYLDGVSVKTISETDYLRKMVGGEETKTGAIVDSYSARYDYTLSHINPNFETLGTPVEGNFPFNLYEEMYGEDSYNKDDIGNNYQYYINKYTSDNGSDKLTEKQLELYHKAYNTKFSSSVVLESKAFETEEQVKNDKGEVETDGDGNPKTEIVPGPNTFNSDNHVLKLENNSEKYTLGVLSAPIEIKQFTYYRLSVYTKGLSDEDSATVKLVSYIKTGTSAEEGAMQVKSQTITAYTTSSDITNNWTEITFYIQGSSYYDTTMQVALLADTESTVYYDNIRLESISSKTYSGASSSKKFDLFPSSTTISAGITNGYFDKIETEEVDPADVNIPYTPDDWTKVSDSSEDVVAGIVSTKDEFYTKVIDTEKGTTVQSKIGGAENPISTIEVNGSTIVLPKTNVLVMYAPEDADDADKTHDYGYKSSSFSLSSNSVYEITFQVLASDTIGDSSFSGDIYANLLASDDTLAQFNTTLAKTSLQKGNWVTYTFVVRTGTSSKSVSIELGIKEALGTVFFQKVGYKKLSEKTVDEEKITVDMQYSELLEEYKSVALQEENNYRFVDLDGNAFVMHSEELAGGKEYYESLSHELDDSNKDAKQGELGVVDTSKDLALSPEYNIESVFMKNPLSKAEFALLIYNKDNYNTLVTPINEVNLSSSSYYEISIYVKTKDIAEGSGLTINMDKISVKFEEINTEKDNYGVLTESNGYKKFTALVKTGTSQISGLTITYELGSADHKCTGVALLSNLEIKKLADEDAYNELLDAVDEADTTTVVKDFSTKTESEIDEDADNLTLATFFLVFSSILLFAVLVLAIVSVYIKKAPKTHQAQTSNKSRNQNNKSETNTQKDGFV